MQAFAAQLGSALLRHLPHCLPQNDVIKKAPVKRPAGDKPPGAKREKKPRNPNTPQGADGRKTRRGGSHSLA